MTGPGVPVLDIVAGARPNFMKIAPIIKACRERATSPAPFRIRLVHTGQHYDARMSGDFFAQLGIPEPDVNLDIGSGTQAEQTAAIMVRYEQLLRSERSALCVVVGDVTSTLACSITARKMGVKVAHVEGGLRSGDWTMPEEINRVVTDAVTNYFFTTSELAGENLRSSGVDRERIFFVGNTMIDTLLANIGRLRAPCFWHRWRSQAGSYFVLTLHRPANVDASADTFQAAERDRPGMPRPARGLPGASAHTQKRSTRSARCRRRSDWSRSQPYLEFNYLVRQAKAV